MYQFLVRKGQLLAFGLGALITVAFIGIAASGIDSFNALPEEEQNSTTIFDFGLYSAVALVILAAVAMLLFGIVQIATNFKASVKGLIGLGVLVAVFGVVYATTSSTASGVIKNAADKFGGLSGGELQFIGGSLGTMLVVLGATVVVLVVAEIINFFR